MADLDVSDRDLFRDAASRTGEAYLQAVDLDLEDEAAILAFVDEYGPLGHWSGVGLDCLGMDVFEQFERVRPQLEAAEHRAHQAETGTNELVAESIETFRFGVRSLRDLVSAHRILQDDLAHEAVEWQSPLWSTRRGPLENHPDDTLDTDRTDGPAWLLSMALSSALEPFSPAVIAARHWDVRRPYERTDIGTFRVLCLELFNHMVESAVYRQCGSDTCQRLFVRQVGRSAHGQHRSKGVMYCSHACARAQANRAYRRRQNASRRRTED